MTTVFLPDPGTWPTTPVTTRDTLNSSAVTAGETQLTVAAENAPLRVIYGQVRLGPQIACVLSYLGSLVILAVWGHGEVDSFVDLQIDDKALLSGVTYTHYTGTAGQTVNSTLVAAFAAQSPAITYTDALPGICYSVVVVPPGVSSGFPRLNAVIKGLKVWNGTATAWSDNPARCTADFITNTVYGMGRSVDSTSVASVAADNDVLAGGTEKMRTLNLALETVQESKKWLETLCTYAGCWAVPSATGLKLVSDKAGSSVATFAHASGNIQSISSVKKHGVQSTPTVLTITYTDTSTVPYRDGTAVVYAAGVLAGTTPRRESQVSLPGVSRYSQAYREATERLNKLLLNDLSFTLGVFDDALALDVGDIVTVTHPLGFTAKLLRVMGITGDYGRYVLNLVEYDPAVYSVSVATAPTYADTTLPNPSAPPAVTGVNMVEEVFQQQDGTYSSRWRVTWPAVVYPYLARYRAELWIGSTLMQMGSPATAEWPTAALQEGQTYTAKIAAISSTGSTGAFGTQSGTALGKQLVPGNVPLVTAFEAGGTAYIAWSAAIDIDIWRYELRYGPVGGTYASATLLDLVDGLRYQTGAIPAGAWTLYCKAVDSVRNRSVTAAVCNLTVTLDSAAFLVNTYDQTAPTLVNMAAYTLGRTDPKTYWITDDGATMASKFTGVLSAYTDVLANYHAAVTASWTGEAEDFGSSLSGTWTGLATVTPISGAAVSGISLSPDTVTWALSMSLTAKATARFARLVHQSVGTDTILVTSPQQVRLDAIPRSEVGTGTSSASGPVTIPLANHYTAVKKLTITPQGTTARSMCFDNVILGSSGSFDVYGFNDSGVKIASPFQYEFQGV